MRFSVEASTTSYGYESLVEDSLVREAGSALESRDLFGSGTNDHQK